MDIQILTSIVLDLDVFLSLLLLFTVLGVLGVFRVLFRELDVSFFSLIVTRAVIRFVSLFLSFSAFDAFFGVRFILAAATKIILNIESMATYITFLIYACN
jgi:hypothetical protein